MRNLQEQVKKSFCYLKLFWPFTVKTNCSSDLKIFVNSWPSASNFKSFFSITRTIFLTVGQNNFGKKIPCTFLIMCCLCPEKLLKAWLQNSHLYAFIFAWVKMCSRSFWFDKNPLPQMSHLYFRFSGSSWFFICFDNCCLSLHW